MTLALQIAALVVPPLIFTLAAGVIILDVFTWLTVALDSGILAP
jgi:hypothetical protein